ncbi:thiopurine S-methyltransferase [Undibacterium cyanobacteriorum]|uniref:Thiopurine S-methyltransferase n=1 Tax=Undibacterium cyanobacteriorum TaxID=3073561 RepID=A0ABY9RFN8_9BURK|nr:thiopurine S-methyltransferase [Undibacterium sp. 20NA77.5]WMW79663.1 thiopurine S-methyltransferase [Undibacterium sp. 20NA77.5]
MDAQFWHDRWQRRELGFHREHVNPLLRDHLSQLPLTAGQTVLVPLCGKTRDIAYLLSQGLQVVGVELSETAVRELFAELFADSDIEPQIQQYSNYIHYRVDHLSVFVGDFFAIQTEQVGSIDAVYDRAALVALPESMRRDYTAHLRKLTDAAPQLLITYEYDQTVIVGPPFSISHEEVRQHYASHFDIAKLFEAEVEGGMKGKTASTESVYLLRRRP